MRIRLVVERLHLPVSARPVERLGLGQGLVGLEPQQGNAALPREVFQAEEDSLSDTQAAGPRVHPHPFDLAVGWATLERATPDRLAVQRREEKVPPWRSELRSRCGNAPRGIEAGLEALGQLFEIACETV